MNTSQMRQFLVSHSAPKMVLEEFDELVATDNSALTEKCVNCNTLFSKDTAPWLQQKTHCPIHDRVFIGECEFCTPEQRAAVASVKEKQQHDAANDSRVASGQEPVPWKEVARVDSGNTGGPVPVESKQGASGDANKYSSFAPSK